MEEILKVIDEKLKERVLNLREKIISFLLSKIVMMYC